MVDMILLIGSKEPYNMTVCQFLQNELLVLECCWSRSSRAEDLQSKFAPKNYVVIVTLTLSVNLNMVPHFCGGVGSKLLEEEHDRSFEVIWSMERRDGVANLNVLGVCGSSCSE